LVR
ncbi:bacterial regulatory, arsR family protein, partial [Vibrio parahaemolyticus V-223/04]|jgi:hypothetical protein